MITCLLGAVIVIAGIAAILQVTSAPRHPAPAAWSHARVAGAAAAHVSPARAALAPATASHQAQPPVHKAPRHSLAQGGTYTVMPGDTLAAIARRLGGPFAGWAWLFQANRSKIGNPDLIYPGQVLTVPMSPPAFGQAASSAKGSSPAGSGGTRYVAGPRPSGNGHRVSAHASAGRGWAAPGGTLGCAGLEALWERAGGSPAKAVTAASIAMAESSGRQYATGPAGERGYWQIHPDHRSLSTYSPYGNARAAVIVSADGTDWSPWTTYTSGAYAGRC